MKFTHLHVHSHFSLLDGLAKIDQLLKKAKEYGMESLAITDHGTMYGAIEFYKKAKEIGIKPIIGCEVYVAFEKMNQSRPGIDDTRYHLVLLAKNEKGYKNLVKLVTKAHLDGFYYKPRIDHEILKKHSDGLIGLSACLQGKVPQMFLKRKDKEAEIIAKEYQNIFGKNNFYLEVQNHPNNKDQIFVNKKIIELSKKTNIPLVATNDIHYLNSEDDQAHDILMLINTGADKDDPERLSFKGDDFSMTDPEKMKEFCKNIPQAFENTEKIAKACSLELDLNNTKLPHFPVPNNKSDSEYLKELCEKGLKKRYPKETLEIRKRLDYELSVIIKLGFSSYFLIVQDFVNWAKEQRIIVGPGRGSAAGSLVSYLLNITNVDPLKHNLLFERFLNPGRTSSLPDIDLDFTDRRRDEVIKYVAEKYGKDKVSQIITFGTMAARMVIRDVGRALQYPYSFCDQLAKMIPLGYSLEKTLEEIKEFQQIYESDERAKTIIDFGKKLEGVARHASTHACGVVISKLPLTEYVPLQYPSQNDSNIVTQYGMHAIEDLGLLKMDFLGLKNLTIIEDTLARIYVVQGKKIDIENIPENDKRVFQLFQKAGTTGVFQLESDGMKRYLKELKPTSFEDIEAMIALYRPGPMELIPTYINRKHKREPIDYIHPKLKSILQNTYGIILYQEQLMQIAQQLAGFSLQEADVLRKAVGKKIKELLDSLKSKFIKGCINNKIPENTAKQIWEWILPFASYGFNKCVSKDTEIIDSETGQLIKIKDLYLKKITAEQTFSLDKNLQITNNKITDIVFNGKKTVFLVKTRTGKKIKVTKNHPFFTQYGWKKLEEIKKGERIAIPRIIPSPKKTIKIEDYKIALLGYLLSEGKCHPCGIYFYSSSKEELKDYISCLRKFKNSVEKINSSKPSFSVYSKRIKKDKPSEVFNWIKELNLWNKNAKNKFIPDFVYQLPNKKIAILIAKMFQGDGCINFKNKKVQIYYATSSKKIAYSLQHLLLRFHIISTIHEKKFKYRKQLKQGYTITICRHDNIQKFIDNFKPYLLKNKQTVLNKIEKNHPILNKNIKTWSARGSKDIIPVVLIQNIIQQIAREKCLTHKAIAEENGFSQRLLGTSNKKIGYLRDTVSFLAETLNNNELQKYADSHIFWDEIVSISKKGKEETFDLTIEGNHNFIANDIYVHNSHSCSYAKIAYQTAYLKAHFPVEFMASLLTSEKTNTERIAFLIQEAEKMGIKVLPPSVNESLKNFTVVSGKNEIRFGLLAIKNVGENITEVIVEERKNGKFVSIADFVQRIGSKNLNKKSLESLIKSGSLDCFDQRNVLLHNLERLLESAREHTKLKENGQTGLFDKNKDFNNKIILEKADPIKKTDQLRWEKELLGLFVTDNPLEDFKNIFEKKCFSINKINHLMVNRSITLGGIIDSLKKITTKKGQTMFFVKFQDLTGKIEVIFFPDIANQYNGTLQEGKIVFLKGKVSKRNGDLQIIAESIEEIVNKE